MTTPAASDIDWVVATARQHDPRLEQERAVALATQACALMQQLNERDAPSLARALMAEHPGIGVSELNAVAKATVDRFPSLP